MAPPEFTGPAVRGSSAFCEAVALVEKSAAATADSEKIMRNMQAKLSGAFRAAQLERLKN
jgi:hypothetical protein